MTAATTPAERWQLGYRPGLDALRGVAVLAVMLGHVNVTGFDSGGWVGVNVFFVLSGFLVTALLLKEHGQSGSIDLIAFYRRRFLRLMPAFVLVVVVVSAVRIFVGDDHIRANAAASLLYYSNWYRIVSGDDMGPLAHTWSLAIEEQFYLVWPLVLLLLLPLVPRSNYLGYRRHRGPQHGVDSQSLVSRV